MKQYSSLKLSKFLKEKGFEKNFPCYWRDTMKDGENKLFTYYIGEKLPKGCVPSYDLLWDICIKYGKELFGEGKCGCGDPICFYEYQGVTKSIMNQIQDGFEDVEKNIMDNCIL